MWIFFGMKNDVFFCLIFSVCYLIVMVNYFEVFNECDVVILFILKIDEFICNEFLFKIFRKYFSI